ncbi:MAG TPA: hypothetical protein VFN31_00995 [Candidatus Saccharimonadales bacterium]|nr:hypothetical protein [Candidatus Saccharimonadales bacterium]
MSSDAYDSWHYSAHPLKPAGAQWGGEVPANLADVCYLTLIYGLSWGTTLDFVKILLLMFAHQ